MPLQHLAAGQRAVVQLRYASVALWDVVDRVEDRLAGQRLHRYRLVGLRWQAHPPPGRLLPRSPHVLPRRRRPPTLSVWAAWVHRARSEWHIQSSGIAPLEDAAKRESVRIRDNDRRCRRPASCILGAGCSSERFLPLPGWWQGERTGRRSSRNALPVLGRERRSRTVSRGPPAFGSKDPRSGRLSTFRP